MVDLFSFFDDEVLEVELPHRVNLLLSVLNEVVELVLLIVDVVIGLVHGGNERRLNVFHI